MKVNITKQMGAMALVFTIDAKDQLDFFQQATSISELPDKCGNCSGMELRFNHRQAKSKAGKLCNYYEITCTACRHRLQFGQHQTTPTLFAKSWERPYDQAPFQNDTAPLTRQTFPMGSGEQTQGEEAPF